MVNIRKYRNIKLVEKRKERRTERRKNYLVLEPNYHTTTKLFRENLLAKE